MDLEDLQDEIGRKLGDPSHDRFSTAVLTERINRSAARVLAYTNAVKTKEDLTPVAGTSDVAVDADTMDVIRVDIQNSSGEWKPLDGILREQLDFSDPNWQNRDDGEPVRWSWDGTNQTVSLIPPPSSEWAQANGLRVWEVRKPADLANPSDVPFDSNAAMIPYHSAIVHDVAADCFQDDGTPEALSKARFHRSGNFDRPGEFENQIKIIWKKFDAPEGIPVRLLWRPQGGRAAQTGFRSKSNPLG